MDPEKRICPYCGEEIMAAAKKCKHCGEWLDKSANEQNSSVPDVKSKKVEISKTSMISIPNIVIVLLVIANLTVGFFWIRSCMTPKSVMQEDLDAVASLLSKKTLINKTDSISYAIGCTMGKHMQMTKFGH